MKRFSIISNTFWNFLGQMLPMLAAFFCIPTLLRQLGQERFGLLTIIWVVAGYFSIFDFGLGKALSKYIAEYNTDKEKRKEIPGLVWTAFIIMLAFTVIACAIFVAVIPYTVNSVLLISPSLQTEVLETFYLVVLTLPMIIFLSALRSILEVYGSFRDSNYVRTFMGIAMFVGPVLMLGYTKSLVGTIMVIFVVRLIGTVWYIYYCLKLIPELKERIDFSRNKIGTLVNFGGWVAVANIVNPVMISGDRFLIGGVFSASLIALYTTPSEMITKLWIVPASIIGVLFPIFVSSSIIDILQTKRLYLISLRFLSFMLFPVIVVVIFFAPQILSLWLGNEFAAQSFSILQILSIGVFFFGIQHIPVELISSLNRPSVTAKIRLVELPVYFIVLWFVIHHYGMTGVAWVWTIRIIVDLVFLSSTSFYLLRCSLREQSSFILLMACMFCTFIVGMAAKDFTYQLILFCVALVGFSVFLLKGLSSEENILLKNYFNRIILRRVEVLPLK